MNRHRFWNRTCFVVVMGMLLAACAPQGAERANAASSSYGAQRSPNIARPLAPDGAYLNPRPIGDSQAVLVQKTVKVALLLPITGRNADLGRALQDAASISLFDKYARLSPNQQAVRVELMTKDTGDTPEQAIAAMKAALDGGAQLIIGPIFSDATESVAALAAEKNVPVLSFSNNLARGGNGTYVFGFSPQEQTTRIVTYALQTGKTHIAVLVPNSVLGETVMTSTHDVLKNAGVTVAVEAKYAPQGVGIDTALATLVPVEGKPSFDAILIPEGGPALDTIIRALATRGVTPSNVQFLGTGIWDDEALLHRVNLDGAWFASSPPLSTHQFQDRFQTTYHYAPPRIASLAYDAVALAVTLATSGRSFDTTSLTNDAGFVGPANGIFRFRPNGQVQRGLAVMKVVGGVPQVISPSPVGFPAP